jgi:hypothetical protein
LNGVVSVVVVREESSERDDDDDTSDFQKKQFFSLFLLLFFFLERRRRPQGVLLPLKMTCWGVVQCSEQYRVRRKQRAQIEVEKRNVRQLIVCCFPGAVEK